VLGQVLELEFGVDLTIGPALEEGFYYDCFMGDKVGAASSSSGAALGLCVGDLESPGWQQQHRGVAAALALQQCYCWLD
jgi:hypothetical protein